MIARSCVLLVIIGLVTTTGCPRGSTAGKLGSAASLIAGSAILFSVYENQGCDSPPCVSAMDDSLDVLVGGTGMLFVIAGLAGLMNHLSAPAAPASAPPIGVRPLAATRARL